MTTKEVYEQYDKKPEYINSEYFFTVKLPNVNKVIENNVTQDVHQNGTQKQKSNEEGIIEVIKSNNKVTRKEMSEKLGIPLRTLQRIINASNIIRYVGSGEPTRQLNNRASGLHIG